MLIQSNVKSGDIVTLKLITSEEIIGKLIVKNSTHYQIANPRIFYIDYSGPTPQPGFMPLAFSCVTDSVDFKVSDVLFCKKSNKDFTKFYINETSTITPATNDEKGLILGTKQNI